MQPGLTLSNVPLQVNLHSAIHWAHFSNTYKFYVCYCFIDKTWNHIITSFFTAFFFTMCMHAIIIVCNYIFINDV